MKEAGERLSELHNQLRLLAVADKTLRVVTTDARTGRKSETTNYVGEGDGPAQIYFKETPPSAGGTSPRRRQRRAPRKQAASSEAPSSVDKN